MGKYNRHTQTGSITDIASRVTLTSVLGMRLEPEPCEGK